MINVRPVHEYNFWKPQSICLGDIVYHQVNITYYFIYYLREKENCLSI